MHNNRYNSKINKYINNQNKEFYLTFNNLMKIKNIINNNNIHLHLNNKYNNKKVFNMINLQKTLI